MTSDQTPPVQMIVAGDQLGRGGLYNMVFPGGFERADYLLPIVELNPSAGKYFRLRDAWVESGADGLEVHIYTRVGGSNREEHTAVIEVLRAHRLYLRDADDKYDSTYASFWFKIDDDPAVVSILEKSAVDPVDTAEKWRNAIANPGPAALKRMAKTFKPIFDEM